MNDAQYLQHCQTLLQAFAKTLTENTQSLGLHDPLRELAEGFTRLASGGDSLYDEGPVLIARIFTTYPDIAPQLPRQLLWFFGGDCLHYMPDDEIDQFQQLEDMRLAAQRSGEPFDLRQEHAKLLNLQ